MTLTRSATVLYVAMVFASGAIVGSLGYRFFAANSVAASVRTSPDEWRKQYMSEMETRLGLTSDQVLRINILLDETRSRVRETHARAEPEISQIKREQIDKIRALLDDKQKVEYEALRKEREARSKQRKAASSTDGL